MTEPGDATGPEQAVASGPAASPAAPDASSGAESPTQENGACEDRAVHRAALRDLAAMIGVEVFY